MRGPRLRVIGINDVYSLENLPRLASLVRHHAQEAPADLMLVTLAGDFVAPSLLGSLDFGRGMVDCLNAVGVTHAILGNHEDDLATGELLAPVVGPEFDPTRLASLARQWGVDLARSSAYGASEGDAFLLSHVGRACAICPDRGLARVARDLGWPIVLSGGDGA